MGGFSSVRVVWSPAAIRRSHRGGGHLQEVSSSCVVFVCWGSSPLPPAPLCSSFPWRSAAAREGRVPAGPLIGAVCAGGPPQPVPSVSRPFARDRPAAPFDLRGCHATYLHQPLLPGPVHAPVPRGSPVPRPSSRSGLEQPRLAPRHPDGSSFLSTQPLRLPVLLLRPLGLVGSRRPCAGDPLGLVRLGDVHRGAVVRFLCQILHGGRSLPARRAGGR